MVRRCNKDYSAASSRPTDDVKDFEELKRCLLKGVEDRTFNHSSKVPCLGKGVLSVPQSLILVALINCSPLMSSCESCAVNKHRAYHLPPC